jgi:hypothetical protein
LAGLLSKIALETGMQPLFSPESRDYPACVNHVDIRPDKKKQQ